MVDDFYRGYKREKIGEDEDGLPIWSDPEPLPLADGYEDVVEIPRSPEEVDTLLGQIQNVMDEIDESGPPDAQRQWKRLEGAKAALNWVLGREEGLPGEAGFSLAEIQHAAYDDQEDD